MAEGEDVGRSLEYTPTWAVATVCFILIAMSLLIEHALHLLKQFFNRRRRKSLIQALHKIELELMLLGFMSLLLTVGEKRISKICISKSLGETFLPCDNKTHDSDVEEEPTCAEKGKVSLLSSGGVNHLHYLIFILAFFHVLSCVLTFALGTAKMKRWESWEEETRTLEYQFSNDPRRFKLTHQTTFGRKHLKFWSDIRLLRWPVCFFRQFNGSVSKTDYFTLRHGFIMAHFAEGSDFDFQKFIRRALDADFQEVVGISLWIWIFSVLFILFNAHGFHNYFWLPFIPLVMLLLVGTKLQVIITKMGLQSHDMAPVVRGTLLVKPSDKFFWFNSPKLLLHLIHFILFQSSFQIAFFTWTWYKFGFRSCFHRKTVDIVIRLVVALIVHVLAGYVTLPLYALVTQMGSSMKKVVFTEQVFNGLRSWHTDAKRNIATSITNSTGPPSPELSPPRSLDASISGGQVFGKQEFDQPPLDPGYLSVEITEEKDESKTDYGGISFRI